MRIFKEKGMDARSRSHNIRTGRFLWMEEKDQKRYLARLRERIAEGYFSSDRILVSIADQMAPVFNDFLGGDPAQAGQGSSYS
jgi:hypothetical protein